MRAKYRKRIEGLEEKIKDKKKDLIPATRIFAELPYYGENVVVGGNTVSLQTLLSLLMDELGLKIVTTPSTCKLEKKPGKSKNQNKIL